MEWAVHGHDEMFSSSAASSSAVVQPQHEHYCNEQLWSEWPPTQWPDFVDANDKKSSSSTAVQEHFNEQETRERLIEIKDELEVAGWTKLQNSLNIALANELATEVVTCIERAILFLDYGGLDSTPRGAVDALRQTTQALEMCSQGPLYTELDAAAKKVRDTLSVRAQIHALPIGDKKKYVLVLEAAYGGRIDDEENSRLMLSYRKTIWEKFPDAFPSNNRRENMQRRNGPRPRRDRGVGQQRRRPRTLSINVRPPPGLRSNSIARTARWS